MKVLMIRSSYKNSNSKKKQSQFSIIFIVAFQYRSHCRIKQCGTFS